MNLEQRKLSKEEWDSLEVPVSPEELTILKMIQNGFDNPNITSNNTETLVNFIKLSVLGDKNGKKKKSYDEYLYKEYFEKKIQALFTKHGIVNTLKLKKSKTKLKTADVIRIKNSDSKIKKVQSRIFEFVLADMFEGFMESVGGVKNKFYYTLKTLFKYKIRNINTILKDQILYTLDLYDDDVSKLEFVEKAYEYIERNNDLVRYKDMKLYNHQRSLFSNCKKVGPKMILYQAPTGTGKTLSPLGLSKKYKIIFVCAAKHVGLQLAKCCIALDIKIAVAFGCRDTANIRLHWSAAKESVRNRKTGGIFRVDNSVGDNVEIMISDIQSYLPAMRYMKAFNADEDLMLYWDEPTITLDYKDHPFHEIMKKNWQDNTIPNIILSSATLPKAVDIQNTVDSFISKFSCPNVITIANHDCSKTIPIVDSNGMVAMPHLLFPTHEEVEECVDHIINYETLLRHLDVREITKFIMYVNQNCKLGARYELDNYFETIESITINSIKKYYLIILNFLKEQYEPVYEYFNKCRTPLYESSIQVTTSDAHTLTDGPTIYLADNVELVGKFCLKTAAIPKVMFGAIIEDIKTNENLRQEIESLVKDLNKNKDNSEEKKTDKTKEHVDIDTKEAQCLERCDFLRTQLKRVQLGNRFIPNSKEHLETWGRTEVKNAFKSSIDDTVVEKIMLLDVDISWRFLLLMGIGVFTKHACDDYVAIMKNLAMNQQLYLIIASTDYIYGTNYQFCHGYIGKDLGNMSQEKIIQGIGRVGRTDERNDYSIRVRDDKIIIMLFTKSEDNTEADNMNRLFCID